MVASPEIIEQVVADYRRAAIANQTTPGRQGSQILVSSDLAEEVMVTGDLHGNRLNFERYVRLAALDAHPRRHLVMQEVCHGGPCYPETTACMSHLLLEDVVRLKIGFPQRFHFLLGNHELAELMDFPITKASRMLNLTFQCGLHEMYGGAAAEVSEAARVFLLSCPMALRLSNGVFVCHSVPERVLETGFDAGVFERPLTQADLVPNSSAFRLLWGRDFRAENAEAFASLVRATVIVHGHEPCGCGFRVPNDHQIVLDACGSKAGYVILPTRETLDHSAVVRLLRELP